MCRAGDIFDELQEAGIEGFVSIPEVKGAIEFHQVRFRCAPDFPERSKTQFAHQSR
ncbi:hypothetical protein [Vibrio hepatarius]|uniref:hypothetical protein n=1 Tax=Vibrio hepatarius TaxID=171383 RepID=UPI001C0995A4|nr:hypothetical protein [Vibrio hepatarius]MBU2895484.1 hypothetical protein [Vibrio hepatarius]